MDAADAPTTAAAAAAAPALASPAAPLPLQPAVHNTVVLMAPKSVGAAVLLSLFFGPLGLLYASVSAGLIMIVVSFVVALISFGIGLFITWPICVIWSAIAANKHNAGIAALAQKPASV